MSAGTLAAIGPDDIAAVRRSHPEAFTPPRTVAMRWIAWLGVVGYLAVSLSVMALDTQRRAARKLPPRPLGRRLAVAVAITALIVAATAVFSLRQTT